MNFIILQSITCLFAYKEVQSTHFASTKSWSRHTDVDKINKKNPRRIEICMLEITTKNNRASNKMKTFYTLKLIKLLRYKRSAQFEISHKN